MHFLLLLKQFISILNIKACKYYSYDLLKTLNGPNVKTLQVSVPLSCVTAHALCKGIGYTPIVPYKKPSQSPLLLPIKIPAETYLSCGWKNLAVLSRLQMERWTWSPLPPLNFLVAFKSPPPPPHIHPTIKENPGTWFNVTDFNLLVCYLLWFFSLSLIINASKPMFLRTIVYDICLQFLNPISFSCTHYFPGLMLKFCIGCNFLLLNMCSSQEELFWIICNAYTSMLVFWFYSNISWEVDVPWLSWPFLIIILVIPIITFQCL